MGVGWLRTWNFQPGVLKIECVCVCVCVRTRARVCVCVCKGLVKEVQVEFPGVLFKKNSCHGIEFPCIRTMDLCF